MKEPLPQAKVLLAQIAVEQLEAERQYDVAFPKSVAIAFGVAATLLILAGAEMFGPVGAFTAMLVNIAAIAAIAKWRTP